MPTTGRRGNRAANEFQVINYRLGKRQKYFQNKKKTVSKFTVNNVYTRICIYTQNRKGKRFARATMN